MFKILVLYFVYHIVMQKYFQYSSISIILIDLAIILLIILYHGGFNTVSVSEMNIPKFTFVYKEFRGTRYDLEYEIEKLRKSTKKIIDLILPSKVRICTFYYDEEDKLKKKHYARNLYGFALYDLDINSPYANILKNDYKMEIIVIDNIPSFTATIPYKTGISFMVSKIKQVPEIRRTFLRKNALEYIDKYQIYPLIEMYDNYNIYCYLPSDDPNKIFQIPKKAKPELSEFGKKYINQMMTWAQKSK